MAGKMNNFQHKKMNDLSSDILNEIFTYIGQVEPLSIIRQVCARFKKIVSPETITKYEGRPTSRMVNLRSITCSWYPVLYELKKIKFMKIRCSSEEKIVVPKNCKEFISLCIFHHLSLEVAHDGVTIGGNFCDIFIHGNCVLRKLNCRRISVSRGVKKVELFWCKFVSIDFHEGTEIMNLHVYTNIEKIEHAK